VAGGRPRTALMASPSKTERLRQLGRSDVHVTQLGLGGASLGDLFTCVTHADALGAVASSHARGVRYFDTAPWYGLGLSESRMGLGLHGLPRDQIILSSKLGKTLTPVHRPEDGWDRWGWAGGLPNLLTFDYSGSAFRDQHRDSLHRLGLGRMDCAVIHDLEPQTWPDDKGAEERHLAQLLATEDGGLREMVAMKKEGLIGAIGAGVNGSECSAWQIEYTRRLADESAALGSPLDFFLLAGTPTLLDHGAYTNGLLDRCEERGISVVLGGPFNSGILATGAVEGAKYYYQDPSEAIADTVGRMGALCESLNVPLASAAMLYPLGHPSVASVIPGAKTALEAERNAEGFGVDIPVELWRKMKEEGLLPGCVRVPSDEA
jgi:D-threo-aldose 1-dehydrogenase